MMDLGNTEFAKGNESRNGNVLERGKTRYLLL